MASQLPGKSSAWAYEAKNTKVHFNGFLTAAELNFQSGSKFTRREFLYLRVLHQTNRSSKLRKSHQDIIPPSTLSEVVKLFNANQNFNDLRSLLSPSVIETWTSNDIANTAQFAVGLDFLHSIVEREKREDEGSPSDNAESITKISTPRKTRSMARSSSTEDVTKRVSKLSFGPKPPKSARDDFDDFQPDDTMLTEASSTDSVVDPEMDSIRETFEREIFELGDEQTVNACLVALIKPVAWILGLHQRVHLDRRAFRIQDSGDGNYLYEARVDGIITDGKAAIQSFVEVKRGLRQSREDVRMQESAQMAAFIHSDARPLPEGGERKKWMVSMGGYEGFITIATYDHDYVEFLKGESEPRGFMTMQEYGAFDLREFGDMKSFLENIAVLMRHFEAEERETDKETI